ncbi:MAG: hypothetical protein ACLR3C_01850 [Eggerthella lenta]
MQGLDDEYWVPEHVREWLRSLGFSLPLEDMEPHIRAWDRWMRALGDFYDYRDTDGVGRVYEVHRRSIHPAMRVCREWGSLLLNDRTQVACEEQACTDWLAAWMARTGFLASAQECVVRAFGLGTGAWALWVDAGAGEVRVRRYDARMVVPLTWDEEDVTECAFVTRAFWRGRAVDQVQLHLKGAADTFFSLAESSGGAATAGPSRLTDGEGEGTYRIVTACFDRDGNRVEPEGVCPVYDTGSVWPTFALVKPAIDNTRVDMSPYGQSVFADAVDAIQAVDLCYDAMMSEIDNGKMRVFLSDVMFDVERDGKGGRVSIPFGKGDCTVFRKVMSTEDTIQEFAPALRTEAQARAFRVALQTLGDLCGFGINYFDLENVGYVKTATEVSADNSALMRNIRRHEHALEGAIAGICRALLAVERRIGVGLPDEGGIRVTFDDSIITDTTAEKRQDMDEVAAGLMEPWSTEPSGTARARSLRGTEGRLACRCEPRRFGWRQRSPGRCRGAGAAARSGRRRAGADEMMSEARDAATPAGAERRRSARGNGRAPEPRPDDRGAGADGGCDPAHAPRLPGLGGGYQTSGWASPEARQGFGALCEAWCRSGRSPASLAGAWASLPVGDALSAAAAVRQREAPAALSERRERIHTPQPPANVKKNVAARPP